jgi:hypothetical protein
MKKQRLFVWKNRELMDKEKLARAKAQLDFKNTK